MFSIYCCLRVGSALAMFSLCPWAVKLLSAQPWAPKPNVADDTGNWSSSTVQELQIRLNGFRGYETTVAADGLAGILKGAKLHHPQHIVRLPNRAGPDGKTRAYFAITQSNRFSRLVPPGFVTDGYWMVAETDPDAYDPVTDQVVDTPGSDGKYVYEEHFNNDRDAARREYSRRLADKGGQMKISLAGDWTHPAKMSAFGGVMLMVGQNWSPLGTVGDSKDAILFYDVRDPVRPVYLGLLDADDLRVPRDKEGVQTIDNIGLVSFENGFYHLGVRDQSFVCHESQDCFINPNTTGKWRERAKSNLPPPVEVHPHVGGQQGDVFHTREIYSEVPAADEPCYDSAGRLYLSLDVKPAECAPAGTYRAMFMEAREDSVVPNSFLFLCDVPRLVGFDIGACSSLDANRQGLPTFASLLYGLGTRTVFSMDANTTYTGRFGHGRKNRFFTQLTGDCSPGGGIYVNNPGDPLIYCASESTSEPIGCPEEDFQLPGALPDFLRPEGCNRIWQNAAAAAPSHGAIRLVDTRGNAVTYRGRGLRDARFLSEPPWGEGRRPDGTAKAVEWGGAQLARIEIISGTWMLYGQVNFESGSLGGAIAGPGSQTVPFPLRSFRVLPEQGISLFEHGNFFGRMVNTIRSNPNISKACGDNYEVCASLARDKNCNITDFFSRLLGEDCEFPRSFNDKASSFITSNNNWQLFQHENYRGGRLGPVSRLNGRLNSLRIGGFDANDQITSVRAACTPPAKPTGLRYEILDGRPLVSWAATPNTTRYEVAVQDAAGLRVRQEIRVAPLYMPAERLHPDGSYLVIVRGVNDSVADNCALPGPSSELLVTTTPPPPRPLLRLTINRSSVDQAGIGSGTIGISPNPASQFGGDFYTPGTELTMKATPNPGSEFDRWAAGASACGNSLTCNLTITANLTVQGIFRPMPRLHVEKQGNATGSVTVEPAGTGCTTLRLCDVYSTGSTVRLTAKANARSAFVGWGGDPDCADGSVTMNASKTCIARFSKTEYLLEVTSIGGVVQSTPQGIIDCGSDCTERYPVPSSPRTISLTAAPSRGFLFVRWYGDSDCWDEGGGLLNQIRVTVGGADVSCNAMFVEQGTKFTLTVEKYGVAAGASRVSAVTVLRETVTGADLAGINCPLAACAQQIAPTTVVQLRATAARGAVFEGWDGDSDCVDGIVTMTQNIRCQARFTANILLVDGSDDDQLKRDYFSVLNSLNEGEPDLWTVRTRGEPAVDDLKGYGRVIWYTGAAQRDRSFSPAGGPSPAAEASLSQYLDTGGCLLLSSPQYFPDRGLTSFAQNYLGIGVTAQDVAATRITGAGLQLPGFRGLGAFPLRFDDAGLSAVSQKSAAVTPAATAGNMILFSYGTAGTAAVARDNGVYRTAFFGFPFLALRSGEDRIAVLGAFLDYCGPGRPTGR